MRKCSMEKQKHTAKSVMELFRQLPEGERAELLKMLKGLQDKILK